MLSQPPLSSRRSARAANRSVQATGATNLCRPFPTFFGRSLPRCELERRCIGIPLGSRPLERASRPGGGSRPSVERRQEASRPRWSSRRAAGNGRQGRCPDPAVGHKAVHGQPCPDDCTDQGPPQVPASLAPHETAAPADRPADRKSKCRPPGPPPDPHRSSGTGLLCAPLVLPESCVIHTYPPTRYPLLASRPLGEGRKRMASPAVRPAGNGAKSSGRRRRPRRAGSGPPGGRRAGWPPRQGRRRTARTGHRRCPGRDRCAGPRPTGTCQARSGRGQTGCGRSGTTNPQR